MPSLKNTILNNSGHGMAISARDCFSELLNNGDEVIIINPEIEYKSLKETDFNFNLSNNLLDITNFQRGD